MQYASPAARTTSLPSRMKPILSLLVAVMGMSAAVRSQEQVAAAPANDSAAAPAIASPAMPAAARPILPTPARIIGHIQDGTLPPPQPLKPAFVVRAKDVLATTTHRQGGRTITIHKIKPIALPPPPEPTPPPAQPDTNNVPEDRAELDVPQPTWDYLFLGVTVFRSKDSPPRSLVNYWRTEKPAPRTGDAK